MKDPVGHLHFHGDDGAGGAMLVFLALNGIELQYTQKDLSDVVLLVAEGALSFEEMVK